jgi:hypothetical protein
VRAAARDRRERLTLETLQTFESREFSELLYYIDTHEMPPTRAALRVLPAKDQVMFIQFAQQMESLGILVAEGILDVDLVDKTLGSFVSDSWQKFKPMVVHTRAHENEAFFSEYFQWLAELIDERMRKSPRQPFHEAHRPGGTRR